MLLHHQLNVMLTLKFVLRGSQGKIEDKIIRVSLRINKDRATLYYPTEMRIHPDKWNAEREEAKSTQTNRVLFNSHLTNLKSKAFSIISDYQKKTGEEPSAHELKALLEGKSSLDIIGFTNKLIDKYKKNDKFWEYKKFIQTRNKLISFAKSDYISIESITPDFIEDFQQFLKQKGLSPNTIRGEIKRFKRILTNASKNGIYLDPIIAHVKIPKSVGTHRTKLSMDEVRQLTNAEITGYDALIRDCFLFSMYCGGMRFGDLAVLKKKNINGDRLQYVMSKSKKAVDLLLIENAKRIIKRWSEPDSIYLLPILKRQDLEGRELLLKTRINARNSYFNKRLVMIMEIAKINKTVTFHCARHTAAQTMIQSNVNIDTAREILGHSDLKITQMYLQSLKNDQDDAMKRMENLWG
jgi:integrase/recombinase XerD